MKKLEDEIKFFCSHPQPMRVLLLTNLIYSLVIPIIELFIGAYIIRNSYNFSLVMMFQLAQATGIPITFFLNGILLKRFPISRMYSIGMILSSVSMAAMMFMKTPNIMSVSIAGLIMGFSYGFFWANRNFLALTSTTNANRNYYYGLETFFSTFSVIIVPYAAGVFIAGSQRMNWFSGNINTSYHILTAIVFLLTIWASFMAHQGKFKNPPETPLIFFTFHRLWKKLIALSVLKGLAHGYIVMAPVMLIMGLVGSEGSLGILQSAGAALSAILLYILGRKATPEHRLKIFGIGLSLFLIGAAANAALYSVAGVLIFVACLVFARPLLDLAYFPIQLGVTELVATIEKKNQFTYIFRHELGVYAGRVLGSGMFITVYHSISKDWALRYALFIVGVLYFFSLIIARSIINDRAWHEPSKSGPLPVEQLKEPLEL